MKKLMTSIGISAVLFSTAGLQPVFAHSEHHDYNNECEVSLNYDVTVEPEKLIISEVGKEKYRIEMNKLFVNNEQVLLNSQQQKLVNQYADEVSTQVPEVIALVHDAVEVAATAVSMALTPLLGDAAGAKIDAMMVGLEKRIDSVAYKNGDKFYLGSTESSLEDAFGDEFEQEMEQLVQSSVGSMIMSLGSQMMSGDGDSFEQEMESFSQKMESIGDDIELQMDAQTKDLEARADKLCGQFQTLVVLEQQLRTEIPELNDFPLIDAPVKALLE